MSTNVNDPTPDDWTREALAPRSARPVTPLAPLRSFGEDARDRARARLAAALIGVDPFEAAHFLSLDTETSARWERVRAALEDDDRLLGPSAPAPPAVRATLAYAAYHNVPHEVGIRRLFESGGTPTGTAWGRVGALSPDDLR